MYLEGTFLPFMKYIAIKYEFYLFCAFVDVLNKLML
jgi:hypothetical protein